MTQPPGLPPSPALLLRLADALGWPLLLLHANGRLEHANRAGRAVLDAAQLLCRQGASVQPAAAAAMPRFAQALQLAARGESVVIELPQAGSARPHLARLQPLLSSGDAARPGRVLLSLDTQRRPPTDVPAYAAALALTATQARVLQLLEQGRRPAEIGSALGMAASTARGHVAAVRRKSGFRSAADLAAALQRLPPQVGAMQRLPLVGAITAAGTAGTAQPPGPAGRAPPPADGQ